MSVYKASLYNYLFNSINSIVAIINGIVMVPLYFHYMPVSVYGAWLASGNVVAMIGLLESGFSGVITQRLAAATSTGSDDEYERLAGANISSALIFGILIIILGLLISPILPNLVNVEREYTDAIRIAFILSLIASAISVLASLVSAFPQVWQVTKQVGLANAISTIIGIFSMVVCLIGGFGVIALGIGYLVRAILNFTSQTIWIWHYWKKNDTRGICFEFQTTKELIKDCLYPFLSRVTNVLMNNSQSLIIAGFLNPTLAAIYDITGKVVSCLCNFLGMTNGSFFAMLSLTFAKKDMGEIKKVIGTIMQYFSILLAIIIVYSMMFSKSVIYYWVGLDKYGGDMLLLLIIISHSVNQYRTFYSNFLFSAGLIKKSSLYDIASLVSYTLLLFVSILFLQVYAIPVSLALSGCIFVFVIICSLSNYLGIDKMLFLKNGIINITITIPFVLAYFLINVDSSNIILQLALLIIVTLLLMLFIMQANKNVYLQLYSKLFKWEDR